MVTRGELYAAWVGQHGGGSCKQHEGGVSSGQRGSNLYAGRSLEQAFAP